MRLARHAWLLALVAPACGMISGLDGLNVVDASAVDASVDVDAADDGPADVVGIDIGTSCEAGTCGAMTNFQPVLFTEGSGTCPQGTTSFDLIADPAPPANACTCACNYQPQCLPQPLVYGTGNTCASLQNGNVTLDGGCNQGNNQQVPPHVAVGPFAPTNACPSKLTQSTTTPTSSPARICTISDCASCTAPPGFQLCFAQSGDVPCDAKMTRHVVGANAKLTCSACSACSSTAKCKGTIDIYDNFSCGFTSDTITVDGTCQATTANFLGSLKYTPAVDPGTCTPGTSDAGVVVSAQTTVCCP